VAGFILQFSELLRYCRRRDAQFVGSGEYASGAGNCKKYAQPAGVDIHIKQF
jgi:hypothetical protein